MKIAKGTQIIYVPDHAGDSITHPDCQPGFIASNTMLNGGIFCRYWKKGPGVSWLSDLQLRTKANSELTPIDMLVVRDTVLQSDVEKAIAEYEGEK